MNFIKFFRLNVVASELFQHLEKEFNAFKKEKTNILFLLKKIIFNWKNPEERKIFTKKQKEIFLKFESFSLNYSCAIFFLNIIKLFLFSFFIKLNIKISLILLFFLFIFSQKFNIFLILRLFLGKFLEHVFSVAYFTSWGSSRSEDSYWWKKYTDKIMKLFCFFLIFIRLFLQQELYLYLLIYWFLNLFVIVNFRLYVFGFISILLFLSRLLYLLSDGSNIKLKERLIKYEPQVVGENVIKSYNYNNIKWMFIWCTRNTLYLDSLLEMDMDIGYLIERWQEEYKSELPELSVTKMNTLWVFAIFISFWCLIIKSASHYHFYQESIQVTSLSVPGIHTCNKIGVSCIETSDVIL